MGTMALVVAFGLLALSNYMKIDSSIEKKKKTNGFFEEGTQYMGYFILTVYYMAALLGGPYKATSTPMKDILIFVGYALSLVGKPQTGAVPLLISFASGYKSESGTLWIVRILTNAIRLVSSS
jgi:hypothetical protein